MALTAQGVVDRIQAKLAPDWKGTAVDQFLAGSPDTEVTGVATAYAPSLEVLQKAVASGKNMIVSRESPFWARSQAPGGRASSGNPPPKPSMAGDPVFEFKRKYIADNKLVVFRLFQGWNARQPDAQLQGLAKALGWERYYRPTKNAPWSTNNGFFDLPPATLRDTAKAIKAKLAAKSIRVGGDPNLRVSRAALKPGMYLLGDIQALLAEPGVNLLVMGEPEWENELSQYSFDLADSGGGVGYIVLGQEVSEDPGAGEMAAWLKGFVKEVPVEWIPAGEPCWMLA
jgi:putative NIF3 family GTP cyclohydrolase 1 type 2